MTSHLTLLEKEADVYVTAEQAALLATESGFDRYACGDIETAVSEICSNAIRHADGGWVAMRRLTDRFEVSVTDTGPGFGGPRKGARGLGIGLYGARRLMGSLEVTEIPGGSRVTAARHLPSRGSSPAKWSVTAAFRTRSGQVVCGDDMRAEAVGDEIRVAVADGLGSGTPASLASRRVLEGMDLATNESPADALVCAHLASRNTRGASAAVVRIDGVGRGVHSALGDVSCTVVGGSDLPGRPGMVGHGVPEPTDTSFHVPAGAAVLLWSDGLRRPDLEGRSRRRLAHLELGDLEEVVREHGSSRQDGCLVLVRSSA